MPGSIQVAQALGITSSAFIAGGVFSISAIAIPPLFLASDPLVTRQWRKMFDLGKAQAPPLAAVSALSYAFLSYKLYGTLKHDKAELYALSALLTISMVPFTLIFMKSVNTKLLRKAAESKALSSEDEVVQAGLPKGESSKELVDTWATYNLVRGLFPLAGSILGLWTTIS